MENQSAVPILFPIEPNDFWEKIRLIIREEIAKENKVENNQSIFHTPGLNYKPLYKIAEVCLLFQITRPTVYEWIRQGSLKPYKIRSRVYFLHQDIQKLLDLALDHSFQG